jgi:hypothetical protein
MKSWRNCKLSCVVNHYISTWQQQNYCLLHYKKHAWRKVTLYSNHYGTFHIMVTKAFRLSSVMDVYNWRKRCLKIPDMVCIYMIIFKIKMLYLHYVTMCLRITDIWISNLFYKNVFIQCQHHFVILNCAACVNKMVH